MTASRDAKRQECLEEIRLEYPDLELNEVINSQIDLCVDIKDGPVDDYNKAVVELYVLLEMVSILKVGVKPFLRYETYGIELELAVERLAEANFSENSDSIELEEFK